MNILWINHEYPPIGGGGATVTKALAREFAALGHRVTVVTAGLNAARNDASFETVDGVNIYRLKCRRKSKDSSTFFEMLSFLCAAFRFVPELVKREQFDAAYVFFGIPNGPLGWYLKKSYKIPYIIALGGGDVPGTQKRFRFVYKLLNPVLKLIWGNAEWVVANSQGLLKRAQRFYSKARFAVIHSGVRLNDYPVDKTYRTDGALKIITAARIVERKGIQHIIKALPELAEKTAGNIHFTVVGDGPYRNEIETLTEKLGVGKYIEITGMLPYEEHQKRLCEADVFVLASHWEGMPTVVVEAMASHLPVIMSNCESSDELVVGNGYIVNSGENIERELADSILTLYNDNALLAEMGEISYKRICEHFLWEKSALKYLALMDLT